VGDVLVIGCGALAHEMTRLARINGWANLRFQCLPAELHNRPEMIPEAVREQIRAAGGRYDRIFVAYADCGTGGRLDAVLAEEKIERLPGAHCYQFFAGDELFERLHEGEPGTFYLTDFLVRNFERLIIRGLGIDRWPELEPMYFGNYRRLVYLAQVDDPALDERARAAAVRLGLDYERVFTGYGRLGDGLGRAATGLGDSVSAETRGEAVTGETVHPWQG
jgi:hypothetical protein